MQADKRGFDGGFRLDNAELSWPKSGRKNGLRLAGAPQPLRGSGFLRIVDLLHLSDEEARLLLGVPAEALRGIR